MSLISSSTFYKKKTPSLKLFLRKKLAHVHAYQSRTLTTSIQAARIAKKLASDLSTVSTFQIYFKTSKGLNSHLSTTKSCTWYMKGKLWNLGPVNTSISMRHQNETEEQAKGGDPFNVSLDGEENLPEEQDWDDYDPMNHEDFDFDMSALQAGGSHRDEFHFIPNTPELPEDGVEGEDGPGPQTAANRIQSAALHYSKVLDDNEDDRTIIWTKNAGDIIHHVVPPKYMPEEENTTIGASKFFPFASELNWKVAQWAVMDGPGHNAFDRLLAIPGVSIIYSYLACFAKISQRW
ncbi:hypothetical protein CVT25_001188 [Psilocybe cyanescens]|uniref:Uncharacterized protein n=1 Tax=Psilocybe cyanescens TaxID=93625 RepID=A0A409XKF3_PSICY|nr:hypothetical protein CVT25_001188 [Psilocybe cyanescens]